MCHRFLKLTFILFIYISYTATWRPSTVFFSNSLNSGSFNMNTLTFTTNETGPAGAKPVLAFVANWEDVARFSGVRA